MNKLNGKIAIVTGAASGMSKSIAELYTAEGAAVMLADFNLEGAQAVAQELKDKGFKAEAIKVDVANSDDLNEMFKQTINAFGSYDILVNNAGVMDSFEPVGEVTDEN
ncbi:SDR family NAD(P)-dependent oxidoreductase [Marinilactibacillus kalidii]|uniref:SDR family NAD(P)-dependent oxidoreductase n=1 Tax=Marinilactibacillus kalidii TaxID=2820274 RepID=UPI002446C59F|nr:SDR family NAD(P)-dependent oxidoreductase [Marinilactibacillus kalidii]